VNSALLCLVCLILSWNLSAQSPTFITKYSTLLDEVPTCAIETPNGDFLLAAKQGDRNIYLYYTLLLKLNSYGDTLKSVILSDSAGCCYIYKIEKSLDGNYFAIGNRQVSIDEMSIWLLKIDENLNILWEKTYKTGCNDLSIVLGFTDYQNNLILYSDGFTGYLTYSDFMVFKVNQDGDSLTSRIYPAPSNQHVWVMIEKPYLNGYYLIIMGRYLINYGTASQIITIDHSLGVTGIDSVPGLLKFYHDAKVIKKNFILSGIKPVFVSEYITANELGILKMDTSFTQLENNMLGSLDTLSYPGYINNLDTISCKNFYYGGTFNQDNNLVLSPNKSWITLAKMDSSLNLLWQKYYGGDLYYGLWALRATSDGGCLLLGSTYDYLTQVNERDIIILKVDSAGVIMSNGLTLIDMLHDAIVFPNPGSDYLVIESGPQIRGAKFRLVNLGGKEVLKSTLTERRTTMDTQSLPQGYYVWQIQYRNKIVEAGKWIKE